MATKVPSPEARSRNDKPQAVASFNPVLRYTVPETAWLLRQSVKRTWQDVRDRKLLALRESNRVFIPGSEIARRSSLSSTGEARP